MSKNKKNVLKVAKGNYPELPKYAGGGSPVSSPIHSRIHLIHSL